MVALAGRAGPRRRVAWPRHPTWLRPEGEPPDLEATARAGAAAFQRNDFATARRAFDAVVAAGRATPQLWLLLARACDGSGDTAAADAALDALLRVEPRHLDAILLKGDLRHKAGDDRAAVAWFDTAFNAAAAMGPLPQATIEALTRADAVRTAATALFEEHLVAHLAAAGIDAAKAPARFGEALRIVSGATQPYFQAPTSFFYPRLPHIPFYEPEDFPWLAAMEAAAPAMRAEVEAVLLADRGVKPYVERPENRPSKEHSLLGDARWSAFHLWKDGAIVADAAAACPRTLAALDAAPVPRIAGRSPMALFSILKAGTHIPPHNGMLNTRLICHIPLIVPPGCRLRVGNETRTVEAGRAMVFDDSIEHEAWNDSDEPRAVLLFEIWRPELDAAERTALTAMFEAVGSYGAVA